jgi:alpha-mannosidase
VTRRAYELNAPLIVSANNQASRTAPQGAENGSWFLAPGSGAEHIVVETVKVAHNGDGLIVRLYEAHNQRGPVSLRFARPIASAAEADLLEREIGPLEVAGNEVRLAVRPLEVKTLRVRLA